MKEKTPNIYEPTQEDREALNDLFFDLYGMPLSWANELSTWDSPLGFYWREALNNFTRLIIKPLEDGEIDVV